MEMETRETGSRTGLQIRRILARHKNREESCLSDQGFSVQPIYSDIFLCSSDWSGTHCELELSHSNPPASSY